MSAYKFVPTSFVTAISLVPFSGRGKVHGYLGIWSSTDIGHACRTCVMKNDNATFYKYGWSVFLFSKCVEKQFCVNICWTTTKHTPDAAAPGGRRRKWRQRYFSKCVEHIIIFQNNWCKNTFFYLVESAFWCVCFSNNHHFIRETIYHPTTIPNTQMQMQDKMQAPPQRYRITDPKF